MIMVAANTVVQIVFLAVPLKINGSALWMSWINAFSLLAAALLILIIRVKYFRALSALDYELHGGEHKTASPMVVSKRVASAFDSCGLL